MQKKMCWCSFQIKHEEKILKKLKKYMVDISNEELVDQKFKTRRTRCVVNVAYEDFTWIHAQISEKICAALLLETPIY